MIEEYVNILITTTPIIVIAIILILFLLKGIYLIGQYEVGIVTKKMIGKKMPQGQVIAKHGEIGVQANTLMPGLYYRFPIIWEVEKIKIIEIADNNVGLVESIDGKPLPKGRVYGDDIECNQFQDAEKFLDNGGFKGPQVAILRPGIYRINTKAFKITADDLTSIASEEVGIVTAQDGIPLPSKFIVAPRPQEN